MMMDLQQQSIALCAKAQNLLTMTRCQEFHVRTECLVEPEMIALPKDVLNDVDRHQDALRFGRILQINLPRLVAAV